MGRGGKGRIPRTPICVDSFAARPVLQELAAEGIQTQPLFFLTHLHGDHVAGLTSSWNFGFIFCSPVTRELLLKQFAGLSPRRVVALRVDEAHLLPLTADSREMVTVTPIDANHCPGAVMFLFEGYFGRILHTGDFRCHAAHLAHAALREPVDALFLDNTFADPKFEFLSTSDAVARVAEIVRRHPEHHVVIAGDSLGKEDFYAQIAQAVDSPVVVTRERLETIELLEELDAVPGLPQPLSRYFTSNPNEGRLEVVPKRLVSARFLELRNLEQPTLAVVPSGWACAAPLQAEGDAAEQSIFYVRYSSHSSFSGLRSFVAHVRPCAITCTVPGNDRVLRLFRALMRAPPAAVAVAVPAALQSEMLRLREQEESIRRLAASLRSRAGEPRPPRSALAASRRRGTPGIRPLASWEEDDAMPGATLLPPPPSPPPPPPLVAKEASADTKDAAPQSSQPHSLIDLLSSFDSADGAERVAEASLVDLLQACSYESAPAAAGNAPRPSAAEQQPEVIVLSQGSAPVEVASSPPRAPPLSARDSLARLLRGFSPSKAAPPPPWQSSRGALRRVAAPATPPAARKRLAFEPSAAEPKPPAAKRARKAPPAAAPAAPRPRKARRVSLLGALKQKRRVAELLRSESSCESVWKLLATAGASAAGSQPETSK